MCRERNTPNDNFLSRPIYGTQGPEDTELCESQQTETMLYKTKIQPLDFESWNLGRVFSWPL